MELINVVDEKGNLTGEVLDRKTINDLKLPHWEVVVFIINKKGEMLLQKRSANKKFNPNKWAPLAGAVFASETIEEGALREIKEELGIELDKRNLRILDENANLTRFFYTYCDMLEKDFVIQKEELSDIKWFVIDDVINMIKNNDVSLTIKENRLYLLEKLKLINDEE